MKKFLLAIVIVLFTISGIKAQEFLKSKDLSTFKVDMLTDEDILKYKQQLQQSGISETQAEQLAIQKGLPSTEILKLRARVSKIESTISSTNNKRNDNLNLSRSYDSTIQTQTFEFRKKQEKELSVFGSELFTNTNLTFEPNLRIPTPKNYVLGPDDEVVVDVFGYQEVNQRITVSPEGSITIPNVGLVPVNGLTIEQATKRIKERMIKSGYSSIASNQSFIQVGVGRIRSIRVSVIGEVKKPGTYTLSSLSTLFNALYLAGGPNEKGSFREIEVVRNGVVITKMDAYDFLLKGDQTKNVRLSDQDVVRIPVAKNQVILKGEIKKPAIFEVLNNNLAELISFSGGFSSLAYKASVHIVQVTDKEKRIKDVIKDEYKVYQPQDGDEIEVGKILDRYDNKVSIKGAVYMPGNYELSNNLTISKLIEKANGLKQDAYISRGLIIRTNQQTLAKEELSFNPKEVFVNTTADIPLKKDDEIIIGEAIDFKDSSSITVEGEVKKPGVYTYHINQTVKDILFKAGGFNDASSIDRVEIGRRVEGKDSLSGKISEIITVSIDKDLNIKGNDIVLKPWDVIMVRSKPNYKSQIMVRIEGEVQYPGTYVLVSKEDKVSELIKRAGGLTKQAFLKGINITRINNNMVKDSSKVQFKKIQQQTKDTSASLMSDYERPTVTIGLNMDEIIRDPGGLEDVILQEGDVLNVAKEKREIKVSGEILFPTDVVFSKGQKLRYYIDRAGGFTDNARKSKVYVLQPNGVAAKTRHFLFFRVFPKIEPGSEILVPKKSDKSNSRLSLSETVALTSAIASLAGIVIAIVNVTKK